MQVADCNRNENGGIDMAMLLIHFDDKADEDAVKELIENWESDGYSVGGFNMYDGSLRCFHRGTINCNCHDILNPLSVSAGLDPYGNREIDDEVEPDLEMPDQPLRSAGGELI
jgi:hypothetical protein